VHGDRLVNWVNFVSEGNQDRQTQCVPHAQMKIASIPD